MYALRIHSLSQLVTVCSKKQRYLAGDDQKSVEVIRNNGCVVVGHDGLIAAVGTNETVAAQLPCGATFAVNLDGTGKCVIPGLVDGHTHPVWSGDRSHEFAMKLAGASYAEVHAAGGGINYTVEHTRKSTEDELLSLLVERLSTMLALGTTLAEAKSGYGLNTETELKMLRVIERAKGLQPIELVANFCGAHSVPKGMTASEAADVIVKEMIPAVVAAKQRGEINAELCDVFHEKGFFESDDSRRILKAAREAGMEVNFHGDELNPVGSGELAGEGGIDALAVSHLEHVSEAGRAAMARRPTAAVLLPTTAYMLRLVPPPARDLIASKVPVALGSDFCPNAFCLNMPAVMNLACVLMRMTMPEALVASTINAAYSIGRSATHGSIEVGKCGDLVVLDCPNWEHLIYRFTHPPIQAVIKKGVIRHSTATVAPAIVPSAKKDDPRLGTILTQGMGGDVVVLGFPHDEGVRRNGGRVGAAKGPAAVRRFLGAMGALDNRERGVDLRTMKVSDGGDVAAGCGSLEVAHDMLFHSVRSVLGQGKVPIVVGGGNDQSWPNCRALVASTQKKTFAVINVDAHFDVRPMVFDADGVPHPHSGSPFRQLTETSDFAERGVFVEFATQGTQCSGDHVAYLESLNNKGVKPIRWLRDLQTAHGPVEAFASLLRDDLKDVDAIFFSFDIDSIRGSDCPGVSCPANVGLTAEDAVEMCYLAGKDRRVCLMDVSELNPLVEDYRTPRLVVQMIVHFLMGFHSRA
eukprot:PhM_4_TR9197/c0_g1_i1/m.16020/K01468/hutI, AMDHD1; imidazolonepropionase